MSDGLVVQAGGGIGGGTTIAQEDNESLWAARVFAELRPNEPAFQLNGLGPIGRDHFVTVGLRLNVSRRPLPTLVDAVASLNNAYVGLGATGGFTTGGDLAVGGEINLLNTGRSDIYGFPIPTLAIGYTHVFGGADALLFVLEFGWQLFGASPPTNEEPTPDTSGIHSF